MLHFASQKWYAPEFLQHNHIFHSQSVCCKSALNVYCQLIYMVGQITLHHAMSYLFFLKKENQKV